MKNYFIYITTEDKQEAQRIGARLIEDRLAACVNIIDGMTSMFWWEGEVQQENETVLIAKTSEDQVDALSKRVNELHSYDCACVVALPMEKGNPEFLQWITDEVHSEK